MFPKAGSIPEGIPFNVPAFSQRLVEKSMILGRIPDLVMFGFRRVRPIIGAWPVAPSGQLFI